MTLDIPLWPVLLLGLTVVGVLALAARRGPQRSARTAARQHLGLWALLALVLAGALLGPWSYAGLWAGGGGLSWVQADGAPTRGTVELVESAVPAELLTPGIAAVALLPALWLVGLAALAQVTWPRETGPRRRAALRSRSWRHLLSRRVLVILGGATVLAAAGIAAMAGLPAVDGVQLSVHTGPESTPFRASAHGQPAGADVAPWFAAAAATVLAAVAGVVLVVNRRGALGGLSSREDLAARRIAVDRSARIGAALLAWNGLAGLLAAGVHAQARDAAGLLRDLAGRWAEGGIDVAGVTAAVRAQDTPDAGVSAAILAATALIAAVLIFARPRAEERILQDGPDADPVATGGDSASGGLDRLPG